MNDILTFLDLAPVGPTQPVPVVAGVLEDQNFTYSVWNLPHSGLINPADGFSDWVTMDLGGPALSVSLASVEPFAMLFLALTKGFSR